jgi:type I restriction enzyme S subunit
MTTSSIVSKVWNYCNIIHCEKQHQIVSEIESRFSVADKLVQTIDENLKKSETLRQSILKKAFEGRLV